MGKYYCLGMRLMAGVYILLGTLMTTEVFAIRYLYTTCWQNLGITHIDFWKSFFRVFHACMALWFGTMLSGLHLNKDSDTTICNNIRIQDLPVVYGNMVSWPFLPNSFPLYILLCSFHVNTN